MNGLPSKPSTSPPTQFQGQQFPRTHTPHTRGPTPPQYLIGAQEADPQSTPYTGVSFPASFQYSNIQPQFVPQYGYPNTHDLNKQAYTAPRMPTGGNPSQATMYQNSTGIRQAYFNQTSMRPSSYQMSQPQPGQGLYPQQQIMFMPPPQYSSTAPQVIMPMTATNYTQRMPSPAYQNSMPTTQQGLFQVPQQNTANFAHTHTYNNPPAVFYNQQAQQQNRPPSASGTSGPGQQPTRKRERTVLQIIDPNSGKDIIQELQQSRSTTPSSGTLGSHSTPVSGQETSHTPQNEIAAQFAAQVAQVALTTRPVANQQRTMADDTPPQQPTPVNVFATHQQSPPPMGRVDNQSSVVTNTLESTVANIQETSVVIDEMDSQRLQEDTCAPDVYPVSPIDSDVQMDEHQFPPADSGLQMYEHQLLPAHSGDLNLQPSSLSTSEPNIKSDFSSFNVSVHQDIVREGSTEHIGLQQQPKVDSSIKTGLSTASLSHVGSKAVSITVSVESALKTRTTEEPASEIKTPVVAEQKDMNCVQSYVTLERKPEKHVQHVKPTAEKTPAVAEQKDTSTVPREVTLEKKPEKQAQLANPITAKEQPVLSEVVPNESCPEISLKARMKEVAHEPQPVHDASTPTTIESSAKDTKKEARSKKKAKDINRKGETIQGSEMDAFMDLPTEEEAPTPVVEKENQDPTDGTKTPDTVGVTERTPTPPIVNEEVLPTVDIVIEDVDSSDASVALENEINEKQKLKYKYKEDQWSPINHEGKKQYDRDFLLQLQNAPESTLKPLDLPDIPDIIIEKPRIQPMTRDFVDVSNYVDFTPRYVWSGGPSRSGGVPRRASGQRGRGGPGGSASQTKHINLSIQKDIELHHAKEAWKPTHRTDKMDQSEVDIKSEELYKKVRSVLNKLTPQKFQTLVAKMQALEIDTEARLKHVIDLVFEKAIGEPGFSVAYANMCRCLSMFKVPAESKQGDVNFRALLLTRCQREFEKANSSEKEFDSKRKEIEKAATEEEKQQMNEELGQEETKAKRRSLGNIRFIGELFKLKMLTENIMHDCVFKLLRTKDEENLECLCRLLKTIGKELETDKAKPRMDQYFAQMQKIVNEKKLSSRVRFMLQDVIELRRVKWVPRRDDNNPKTIDQIHREVAQEAQDRAIFVQNLPQAKPQKGSRGRPSGQPSGSMGGGADGWNTVSRAPLRTDRTIDPTKLKLSKLGDSENIQLGPGGGAARLGWFKGSTGGGARSQEGERPNTPGNRFSALSKADKSEEDGSRRGGGRGGFGRPGSSVNRTSQESEREKAIAAAKTIVAQRPSEERSGGREPERVKTMEKPSTPVLELTDDQMGSKTRAIMDEYLHIQDVGEAISCVQELSSSSSLHLFVYNSLNQVLERSEVARRMTGLLLHDLVKKNVILVDTYVKGLNEILMYAEDMEIDIPKIWEYFGQLIGPMVQDGSVPLGFLKQVCEPLRANSKSGILVAEILHDASHREGHKKVARLWAESGLHWSDFVPKNQIDQFLSDKKLEFTQVGNSAPTSPTTSMAIPMIEESLNDLITNRNCSNEEVFDWIEGQVDELTVKQEHFIRALMTAVCRSAVTVSSNNLMKVDKSHIQKRNNLLQKYLDHQANFELQALFALQALVHKLEHPPGVLRELFDILYDEDIISEDAFIQWEKSEDPQEQEGKGVAMKQVVQFFTWLKEAEDDAES